MNKLYLTIVLCLSFLRIYSQVANNQDCITKKIICGTTTLNDNNFGPGTVRDLNSSNSGCLGSGAPAEELNSSWYAFTIKTSGTLTFTIGPTNGMDDYDFGLWGPNPACPPTNKPLRCSVRCYGTNCLGIGGPPSASTGLNMTATDLSEDPDQSDGFVKYVTVTAGETYYLMVNNSSPGVNAGFTLSFGTAAGSATLMPCPVAAVPLELISFSVSKINKSALLTWSGNFSSRGGYFLVQKSADGLSFSDIGRVEVSNNTDIQNYRYTDISENEGTAYYRLLNIDKNGNYSLSKTANLVNENSNSPIKVLTIRQTDAKISVELFSGLSQKAKITLISISGKKCFEEDRSFYEGINSIEIPFQKESGFYFLNVSTTQSSETFKIPVH